MTELEKNTIHNKFNFFKKKDNLKESNFIENKNRACDLIIFIFFQPLILINIFIFFGFTNVKEILEIFYQHQKTIFNFGLYLMALLSLCDFVISFFKGFILRKTNFEWGMKWVNKAFSLSMTNFITYYILTAVAYSMIEKLFKI